jgi:hypothetical protein
VRTVFALVLALSVSLLPAAALRAEEPRSPRRATWSGYLWKDAEGRTRLGWTLIAMGVMAMPVHEVAKSEAERLAPLLSPPADDYVFWNYDLDREGEEAFRRLPRHLVRLDGVVTSPNADPEDDVFRGVAVTLTMSKTRVVAVEVLPDAWLRAWAEVFREGMPFRIDVDESGWTKEKAREAATRVLAALCAMRAVPGPTSADHERIARVEPTTRVVQTHRRETEWSLQRWVVEADRRHGLALPGLADLGRMPPSGAEVNRWFLEAKGKEEFFARVRAAWDGDLDVLRVGYYETGPNWATLRSIDLERMGETWDEAAFVRHRDATTRTLGR